MISYLYIRVIIYNHFMYVFVCSVYTVHTCMHLYDWEYMNSQEMPFENNASSKTFMNSAIAA